MKQARPLAASCLMLLALCGGAHAEPIAPFKDELFAYGPLTASQQAGRFLNVPYDEAIDIDRRDEIPERRVRRVYVDLKPVRTQRHYDWQTSAGEVQVTVAGERSRPAFIVVFVHGKGGDRALGMNDWSFGGNFNRLKNLVSRARGLYVTVSAGGLSEADGARMVALVASLAERFSGAPIIMACGSMGSRMCWSAATSSASAAHLSGVALLGGHSSAEEIRRAMAARGGARLPVLIAHGSRDPVYAFAEQKGVAERVLAQSPGYPLRFVGFDNGNHGTPIRMIDWRDTLNWMLTR